MTVSSLRMPQTTAQSLVSRLRWAVVLLASLMANSCWAQVPLFGSARAVSGYETPEFTTSGLEASGFKTLGGRVEWNDQLVWSGWRIQQNTKDGRHRLLDDHDRRMAVGSFEYCIEQLVAKRGSQGAARSRHVVVLTHGLAGSRNFMGSMESDLEKHGFEVVSVGYASTKESIQDLTVSLECVIRNLDGVEQVSFVAHSMGNILVRHLLYRLENSSNPPNIQFCRMVMISPPNQGAYLADTLGQRRLIQSIFGPAVDQFARQGGWLELERELATPAFEFGIIAGGRGTDRGYLNCVPGDDDGLLSIDSHYLEGASDFLQVGGLHQLMPQYRSVKEATVQFLRYGRFSEGK